MLNQSVTDKIVGFVRKEPRTVQDVAMFIGRSWVTAESYCKKIETATGLVHVKTFRKGTQGALKIVYASSQDQVVADVIQDSLFTQIKAGRKKTDFDFMEVFQHIVDDKKESSIVTNDENFFARLSDAKQSLMIFSGNLSFLRRSYNKQTVVSLFEEMLERNVRIKIVCRVTASTLQNLRLLDELFVKFDDRLQVHHVFHPLRGFVVDSSVATFSSFEYAQNYQDDELDQDHVVHYDVYDPEWIGWLQKVFWSFFRSSISAQHRRVQLEKYN